MDPKIFRLGPLKLEYFCKHFCKLCKPRLFADDTLLWYSSKDLEQQETLCKNELLLVKQWMDANKLKTNPTKSKAIAISHE